MSEDDSKGLVGWLLVAVVLGLLVAALFIWGCADKKITRTIVEQIIPVEHPTCPPHQCWQTDKCGKCDEGD